MREGPNGEVPGFRLQSAGNSPDAHLRYQGNTCAARGARIHDNHGPYIRRQAMKIILSLNAMLLLTASAHAAVPGDATEGKRLHDDSCTACHDSSVYTRKDHK